MSTTGIVGAPIYRFQVAPDLPFESSQALYLTNTLLSLGCVAFQIVARASGIRWQVVDLTRWGIGLDSLRAHGVVVQLTKLALNRHRTFPFFRGKLSFITHAIANRPILYISEFKADADPLIPLAQSMSQLGEYDEIRYTVLVTRQHKPLLHRGLAVANTVLADDYRYPRTFEQVIEHKLHQPWYECAVLVDIDSPDFQKVKSLRQALDFQLSRLFDRNFPNHPLNGLRTQPYPRIIEVKDPRSYFRSTELGWYARSGGEQSITEWWQDRWSYFEAAELAALWHLPHQGFEGANVRWLKPKPGLPRELAKNQEGVILGQALYHGARVPARVRTGDRATHLNIVGRTGVGKSTFMHHLIHQDIAAGRGVAVIDPHGSLVRNILRCSIPPEREADVVVLDLNDADYPIPLNVFVGAQSYAAIGRVVDSIERLYATTGVRMDKYLRAGIRALEHVPDATMKDLYRLFTDPHFRYDVLGRVQDDETFQTLHDEYHAVGEGQQRMIRGPILNRISPFYANPYLYPSLCHPQRVDFAKFIAEGKVVLIALGVNAERVPQKERDLVGALIISLFQMVGMQPNRRPTPFYVYIDEVQNFITSSLEVVFSEARKYGLAMTVAHQFFGQLSTETLQAIMGNVGTTVVFRSNVDDARALAPYMQPQFDVQALVNLDKFQAAVKMQHQGITQDAFMLYPQPPLDPVPDSVARGQQIRALSAEQYLPMSREDVLDWLNKRYPKRQRMVQPPPHPTPDVVDNPDDDDFYE